MRHDTLTDSSPPRTDRTTQPGGVHRAGFESTLPPEALNELLKRRQPVEKTAKRLPARPPSPTRPAHDWRGLALALLGLALVAIIVMSRWRQPSQPVQPQAAPTAIASAATPAVQAPVVHAVQPAASPQPTPSAEPIQPPAAVEHVIEQPILPPRAQLLKLPTPRASVVRLPAPRTDIFAITSKHIDQTHTITMPYGTQVSATLRGFLEQESQLPRVGHIGDMYVVGSMPWIWIQAPGTTAQTWIDP